MVATALPVDGADFTDHLGFFTIPHRELFLEDYLLRGGVASLKNRLNDAAAPMTVIGAPTFDDVSVKCVGANCGLATATTTSGFDRTTFTVFQHTFNVPQTTAEAPPSPKPGAGSSAQNVVSWNNGGQFARTIGAEFYFRASTGNDVRTGLGSGDGNGNGYQIRGESAFYYPDGTIVLPRRWVILVTMSNGTEALFSLEHEVPMQTYGPLAHSNLTLAASVTKLFGFGAAGDNSRAARLMIAKAMTLEQIMRVVLYLRQSMRGLGIVC